jgi:hypothetical protein
LVKLSFPFERFVHYRFDYASLVVDSVRAFASNEFRVAARLLAALFFGLLIAPPLITLLAGRQPFGTEILFAAIFIVWPWVLEFPAWSIRQIQADASFAGHFRTEASAFDWFMHAFFALLAGGAIVCLLVEPTNFNRTELAALWAVALAGGADMVRSVAAWTLAALRGFPLYGERTRR